MSYSEFFIVLFGVPAIWLTQTKNEFYHKYACIFGLLSQPFWFYDTLTSQKYGMFFICLLYASAWANGFYNNWVKGR